MKAYLAFVKKEFCEQARTYKLLVLGMVFLILGMMNPLTAKFTPQLLSELMPEGMRIEIAEPTIMDSWMQFFKNVTQMGLIVVVIMFSGAMAGELSRGTLIPILTKGMSRKKVIWAKFTALSATWTLSYVISFAVTYLYNSYFWSESVDMGALLIAVGGVWLFGMMLVAATLLGGTMFANSYGSLLFTGLLVVIQFIVGIVPKIGEKLPTVLVSQNMALLYEQVEYLDFAVPAGITVVATILFLVLAIHIFEKKNI